MIDSSKSKALTGNISVGENWSARRLNRLIDEYGYKTYLEIGVSRGTTFTAVRATEKIGVDPRFRFSWEEYREPGAELLQITSDSYFEILEPGKTFDVAFIDGLHTFEQTLRDLLNVLPRLNPGGTVLVDDTVPIDSHSALRNQVEAVKSRKSQGLRGQYWHGDVYKVVVFLHDHMRQYGYSTILESGNPQTMIWQLKTAEARKQICSRIADIDTMNFEEFSAFRGRLAEAREDEVFAARAASLS